MSKTLKELGDELKDLMIDLQMDAYNRNNFRPERYNNLQLKMDIAYNPQPHVIIVMAMSMAEYDLKTLEKLNGGLGQDERYLQRWFARPNTIPALMQCWENAERNRGRIYDKYRV